MKQYHAIIAYTTAQVFAILLFSYFLLLLLFFTNINRKLQANQPSPISTFLILVRLDHSQSQNIIESVKNNFTFILIQISILYKIKRKLLLKIHNTRFNYYGYFSLKKTKYTHTHIRMYRKIIGLYLTMYFIMTHCCGLSQAVPILGNQTQFDDNSKVQGKLKPIFVYCDEIGNHLNCMLFCRNMGHTSGNCGGDFICDCF